MYPTIADLIFDLLGIHLPLPLPTFGFFVAIAFLTAAYFFTKELKRKEEEGYLQAKTIELKVGEPATLAEILGNGLIGFLIFFKIGGAFYDYETFSADLQAYMFSLEGNLLFGIVGLSLFGYLRYREKEKEKLPKPKMVKQPLHPHEMVSNMTMIAAIAGILGAKVFHNLENINEFMADPIGALVSFSGLSIYGGLIVGGGAVLYYAIKNGMKWIHVADACAPGLMAAYGVGRIGCQMSGDGDWGMPNPNPKPDWMSFLPDWMWSFSYEGNVLGRDLGEPGRPVEIIENGIPLIYEGNAWPTPFYETLMAFAIFGILWALRKKVKWPGFIFSLYLAFNGVERFFIEKIRINPDYQFLGIEATQAEIIAVLMFVFGIAGIFYFKKNQKHYLPTSNKE